VRISPPPTGTLGFLVAVELKILPIKPFMHVKYIPCHTKEELCSKMKHLSELPDDEAPQFLEATVYSKETSVIMVCEFDDADTAEKRSKINGVNYFWCAA
jgi:delta24-sterol reductase